MDIKSVITKFEKSENGTDKILHDLKSTFLDEQKLWHKIENLNTDVFSDGKLMNFLANVLQLVNDENRIASYDLEEIENIYRILVKHNPYNLQYQIDLISFVNNVMGDENEARLLADNAIKLMDEKRFEMENLLKD